MNDAPHDLRQRLRALRRALPPALQQQTGLAVAELATWPGFTAAARIAGYWACDGELNPMPLLERAWAAHQQVYLPVLTDTPPQSLQFAPRRNRFNSRRTGPIRRCAVIASIFPNRMFRRRNG